MAFLMFYVTHSDEDSARRLVDQLLEQRLIACANIHPVSSAYWWEGNLCREGEWVSILKTRNSLEARLEEAVLALHPYTTPCIVRWEVRANAAYEAWIEASTERDGR